jgi:radical SAM superfamily enzyme
MTTNHRAVPYNWREAGLSYFAYNFFLRNRFGHRVQRVSVDAGFTCPNVDGT